MRDRLVNSFNCALERVPTADGDRVRSYIQMKFVQTLPGFENATPRTRCDHPTTCYPAVNDNPIILLTILLCQLKQQFGTRPVSCSYNNVGVIETAFLRTCLFLLTTGLRVQQTLASQLCRDCLFVCLCFIR